MLKGVIFDFDGTLFDSMLIWETAGKVYLRSIGKEPEENLKAVLKPITYRSFLEVCFGLDKPMVSSGTLGAPPYAAI